MADYFDGHVDQGRTPEEFGRIWIHTHPGDSPFPSGTDEETFDRCFGSADWALMLIVARGGATYARLRFGGDPGGNFALPIQIDFQANFPASDHSAWEAEYLDCVSVEFDSWRKLAIADFDNFEPLRWTDRGRKKIGFGLTDSTSDLGLNPFLEHCDA